MKPTSEPSIKTFNADTYVAELGRALNWYNYEKEKKDARVYLRDFLKQSEYIHTTLRQPSPALIKKFDGIPDSEIITTYGWVARLHTNKSVLRVDEVNRLEQYLTNLITFAKTETVKPVETEKAPRPSVRDYMQEKINEYVGELEGYIDDFISNNTTVDLYKDLQSRSIPKAYCTSIDGRIKVRIKEFITAYEGKEEQYKEGYSNLTKRQLTSLIKMLGSWVEDLEKYAQFKKANRKIRPKKLKSPMQQVTNVKYKKEDTLLNIKSEHPSEMVGASQVWVYNTKYKKLAAYRSDSSIGIQVKGTTLQNYDPSLSEQKSVRRPEVILKLLLKASKVQLRKFIKELETAESTPTGRLNEECIIVRVVK